MCCRLYLGHARLVTVLDSHEVPRQWGAFRAYLNCRFVLRSLRSATFDSPSLPRSVTSSLTGASPLKPSARAPAGVTSITRPATNGPRSVIVTTTDCPLLVLVTRTLLPKGRLRWAAVKALSLSLTPLAVVVPSRVE